MRMPLSIPEWLPMALIILKSIALVFLHHALIPTPPPTMQMLKLETKSTAFTTLPLAHPHMDATTNCGNTATIKEEDRKNIAFK
jgi:hypothetical protein